MLIALRPPIESGLSSESRVHIHLIRMDQRFSCLTRGKIERHTRKEEGRGVAWPAVSLQKVEKHRIVFWLFYGSFRYIP